MTLQQKEFLASLQQEIRGQTYQLQLFIRAGRPQPQTSNLLREIKENKDLLREKERIYLPPVQGGLSKKAEKRARQT
ncbi:Hypothetical protein ZAZAV_450 [Cedratvirus Zaza IHUMI]|uniref:Uncharacterized protein n=1 Tax=Cedratvirus Zaza IHUMI TaxID=2126979 RepID=A0A2R8FFL0_9VIRU|nr:Hypothetical protein ZAZAV_450 [Cedratvirus Zaza IHUMI]